MTGGGDGVVTLWNYQKRKRITQFDQFPTSISSLAFNYDGSQHARIYMKMVRLSMMLLY